MKDKGGAKKSMLFFVGLLGSKAVQYKQYEMVWPSNMWLW